MAYSNRTSARQTAVKAATDLTVAYLNAGLISSIEDARNSLKFETDSIFTDLEGFIEDAPASAKAANTSRGNSSAPQAEPASGDPRDVVMKGGKFAGQTLGAIYDMPAEVASAAPFNYKDKAGNAKAGKEMLKWIDSSSDYKNKWLQEKVRELFEKARAGSEEAA